MRAVSRGDYDIALRVVNWPLIEVLHAFMEIMRHDAVESYRHSLTLWALAPRSKKKLPPPKRPGILDG